MYWFHIKRYLVEMRRVFVKFNKGGNHDVYVRNNDREVVPRHKEINEKLAKAILRKWGL